MNSIAVKEDLFDSSFFGGPFIFKGRLFCHAPRGSQERGDEDENKH